MVRKSAAKGVKRLMSQALAHFGTWAEVSAKSGVSISYLSRVRNKGDEMSEEMAERIRAAMRGEQPEARTTRGPNKKAATNRWAIVLASEALFTSLYDLGKAMAGEWKFKKKAGSKWLGVVQLGSSFAGFVAFARAEGAEVFLPDE